MSNVAKLKKQAAEFELKKQYDKALELYTRVLEQSEGGDEEIDVALYNRVGDLALRGGNVAAAVRYYEQAVERYSAAGLFNNAIALCNKILRHTPGRTSVYYTLGVISAQKGFTSDAKQNFLEYAERMQQAGNMEEAVRALKEFAQLCPEEDDVRFLLAEHLSKTDRKVEAVEQLQSLYEKFAGEGRQNEARLTATRIQVLDPSFVPRGAAAEPRVERPSTSASTGDLVFIDVSYDSRRTSSAASLDPVDGPAAPAPAAEQPLELVPSAGVPGAQPPTAALDAVEASPSNGGGSSEHAFADLIDLDVTVPDAGAPRADAPVRRGLSLPGDLPMLELQFEDSEYAVLNSAATVGDDPLGLDPMVSLEAELSLGMPLVDAPTSSRVTELRARAEAASHDRALRRELAEALFDDGNREAGIFELETVMDGYGADGEPARAFAVATELTRVAPAVLRYHERRLHFATRAGDPVDIRDAHADLGDAQLRSGRMGDARESYERLLQIAPGDARALAALETLGIAPKRPATLRPPAPAASAAAPTESFIDLGDLLRDDEPAVPKSTRMITQEPVPTGDEQADFQVMLRKFKEGLARNVDEEDFDSHYDLGVAFKEMGLLDEAIAEFQKALRAPGRRLRAYEALGQCFLEKTHFEVARTVLARAVAEAELGDDELVGVLYLLGYASEALQLWDDAQGYYQRVLATDIQFRDASERLALLARAAR